MRAKKYSCRWWDYSMDCCRNMETHPNVVEFEIEGQMIRAFVEPACKHCKGCGYEKADAEHPRWDAKA